ncbi:hypothetical protein SS1G_12675 [Sclerotinia sclerotiorum 1980 UF-70]|uniref:Uncharacterized protein n=1 Tax=Sclerotinia sclerotiorum (strain ATCC 18683 / 1980 / Ss-1) TaxID=665079 RepID=A7F500_SCLS1|nr:hypothetical protein SS1G_12675 [Sclerotinia sclerotiorum 1980 UF-70]EDN97821.1 hypothetical protein SS1G_12675 [Sclerotinia sclerotiorum 1980 UF-70]
MVQADGQLGSVTPGNPPDPSLIWTSPWSAGWMETASKRLAEGDVELRKKISLAGRSTTVYIYIKFLDN